MALLVVKGGQSLTESQLMAWCSDVLPKYQMPRDVRFVESIPKNAMGKINKKALLKQILDEESQN